MFTLPTLPEPARARVRVKICGITNPVDAAAAVELGADALGINFYPASPRCVDRVRDAAWLRELAGLVPRVAVLVNPPRAEIDALLAAGLVDSVQLHGDETPDFCQSLAVEGVPFAKALRVRGEETLPLAATFHTPWIVLDAYDPQAYGGTGKIVDWTLAALVARAGEADMRGTYRVILSGGLQPDNVATAVAQVRPFAVDVASGVESPGDRRQKDRARMEAFLTAVRASGPLNR